MTADDFIRGQLVLTGWRMGRTAGANGMIAVMQVVRNRVTAGKLDGNWLLNCAYIEDPRQLDFPDPREPEFQKALQAVDGIYEGTLEDRLTDGAVFLTPAGYAAPRGWSRCAVVGNLQFFK